MILINTFLNSFQSSIKMLFLTFKKNNFKQVKTIASNSVAKTIISAIKPITSVVILLIRKGVVKTKTSTIVNETTNFV